MAIDAKYLDEVYKVVKGLLSENRQKIDEAFLQAPGGIKLSVGIHIKDDKKFKVTMGHSQKKIDCVKEVDTQQPVLKEES
jgi:hypothetical protein